MKTNDLEGDVLGWAVAKCMGWDDKTIFRRLETDEEGWCIAYPGDYLTDWAQGGPIIGRVGISLEHNALALDEDEPAEWCAYLRSDMKSRRFYDADPLVAAMRCYVASMLGDEVEIPEELT